MKGVISKLRNMPKWAKYGIGGAAAAGLGVAAGPSLYRGFESMADREMRRKQGYIERLKRERPDLYRSMVASEGPESGLLYKKLRSGGKGRGLGRGQGRGPIGTPVGMKGVTIGTKQYRVSQLTPQERKQLLAIRNRDRRRS